MHLKKKSVNFHSIFSFSHVFSLLITQFDFAASLFVCTEITVSEPVTSQSQIEHSTTITQSLRSKKGKQ